MKKISSSSTFRLRSENTSVRTHHSKDQRFKDHRPKTAALARTCSCGRFQHGDVPCGHATAIIPGYRDPTGGPRRSVRDFVAYNLTVPAFRATYAVPMPPIDIAGLQPRNDMLCRAPLIKKARGRPQAARLTARE